MNFEPFFERLKIGVDRIDPTLLRPWPFPRRLKIFEKPEETGTLGPVAGGLTRRGPLARRISLQNRGFQTLGSCGIDLGGQDLPGDKFFPRLDFCRPISWPSSVRTHEFHESMCS